MSCYAALSFELFDVHHSLFNFPENQLDSLVLGERHNARHHPPRRQLYRHSSLADESYAIRGRVHAVVRRRAPQEITSRQNDLR